MKSVIKFLALTSFIGGLFLQMGLASAETSPEALVKQTADEVISIIKNDKDMQAGNQQQLYSLIETKIFPNFDFDRVCRMVLGKNWKAATPDQQSTFQKEFRTLLLRTYSSALAKYKDQTIEYKPMRYEPDAKNVNVKTQVLQPGGQPVAVEYSLVKSDSGWKVYDISIEGVSLVTNYRSQFSSEIRQNGLDGLNKKLIEKNKSTTAK